MPRVRVEQGLLEGIICEGITKKYLAFKGIPYAKPPVGPLRFKAPEPPDPWDGVREASQHGPICPQYNERKGVIETGSEDCLYLNVYTNSYNPKKPLPVMVWIHGGSFYTGSGNSDYYGPDFFMAHDVILVTFNYRLEVLGFLCLENDEVPGNAGLKDQVAAMKWVKKNIKEFGGDNNNITIFGCSAGAASTSFHLISKMSQGLFNKAICQSGVCLNEWSYNLYPRQRAFQLGKLLGKDTQDPMELLEFLRNVPSLSLVNIQLPILENKSMDLVDSILFGPVIEKSNLKVKTFITTSPEELVKRGHIAKVPIIVGYTSGEGIEIVRNFTKILKLFSIPGSMVPRELKLKWPLDKTLNADLKIRKYYFNAKEIDETMLIQGLKFATDRLFTYNIRRFARYHVQNTSKPVFLYKFTAETDRNYTKKQYKMEFVDGVCHADDLPYLFNITCLDIPLSEGSRKIIKQFVQLWVDFAISGNPTDSTEIAHWKSFTENEKYCFSIGPTLQLLVNENEVDMKFWDEIYGEISIKPDMGNNNVTTNGKDLEDDDTQEFYVTRL